MTPALADAPEQRSDPTTLLVRELEIALEELRVAEEERLLRACFGDAYEAYAHRVKRFVPGIF